MKQGCRQGGPEDGRLIELHHLLVAHGADALAQACTASYAVGSGDVTAGFVTNTATASILLPIVAASASSFGSGTVTTPTFGSIVQKG